MKTFKQVPPENQIGADFDFLADNPIIIAGNKDYYGINKDIYDSVLEAINDLQNAQEESENQEEWPEFLEDLDYYFPPKDLNIFGEVKKHSAYSTEELAELKAIFCDDAQKWVKLWNNTEALICRMLTLQYGTRWKVSEIRGYSQGEWNCLFYPACLESEEFNFIRYFEDVYFNKGSEWMEQEEQCYYYVPGYEDAREFLAAEIGEKPEDITLLAFDGYIKMPKYKEI